MLKKEKSSFLSQKILVIVTGSIAAIKAPILVSRLIQLGADVRCVITPSASKLVSPLSLTTLSRNICYQDEDQWRSFQGKPLHIDLAEWADLVVIAPLTASSLSKYVYGSAEGLVASILLATEVPIVMAAAMNTAMWQNSSVKRNWNHVKKLKNIICLEPGIGLLACDRIGEGRMVSLEVIELAIESGLIYKKKQEDFNQDFKDLKILVTTGSTIEDLDSVRYVSNRSSGKMGLLIAQSAKMRGANVDLIHGPNHLSKGFFEGLNLFPVRNSSEMEEIIKGLQPEADVIVMAAAISDVRTKNSISTKKIPKELFLKSLHEDLELAPDLLKKITARKKRRQIILGFAALSGSDEEIQKQGHIKRNSKECDLLMANPIDRPGQGFEEDCNGGFLLAPNEITKTIPVTTKSCLSHQLLDEILSYRSKFLRKC